MKVIARVDAAHSEVAKNHPLFQDLIVEVDVDEAIEIQNHSDFCRAALYSGIPNLKLYPREIGRYENCRLVLEPTADFESMAMCRLKAAIEHVLDRRLKSC